MDPLEVKNSILVTEFDRYIMEHPEFAAKIPQKAHIVLQVEGDEEYNEWTKKLAREQTEEGQPIVFVLIRELAPARSRLISPELQAEGMLA